MPLYIDLHIDHDHNLTLDIIKQFHLADKSIQDKYGVRYLQILLNKPQGYLFCLVEGPDKESCARVHQEAHGNIACNVLEITESDFGALLANKPKDGHDFTLNLDGTLDSGNRAILALNLVGSPESYQTAKEIILNTIRQNDGRHGDSLGNQLVAVFDSGSSAIQVGIDIQSKIKESGIPMEVRVGVSMGSPLEETGNFFEEARTSAGHFAFVSSDRQVTISSKVMQFYQGTLKSADHSVKVISPPDEKFLNQVMQCLEKVWDKNDMTMADFARELGFSKSQLARKFKSLTNVSPNDFIKEFRLRKSIHLMEDQQMNIAEVTMAIGFSNPSYFTKCFRKRFGKTPSDFMTGIQHSVSHS